MTKFITLFLFSLSAFAAAPDYASILGQIDFSPVINALMIVFAGLTTVFVAKKGGRIILNTIDTRQRTFENWNDASESKYFDDWAIGVQKRYLKEQKEQRKFGY